MERNETWTKSPIYLGTVNFFRFLWKSLVFLVECVFPKSKKFENENGLKPWSAVPHAKGLPFLGTLVDFIRFGGASQLHNYAIMRHDQLGPILRESLGGREILFISSPELFTELRKQEGSLPIVVMSNSQQLYIETYKDAPKGLISSTTEATWTIPRQKLNDVLLKNPTAILDIYAKYEELIPQYMQKWKENAESNITNYRYLADSETEIVKFAIHAMAAVTFGTRCDEILRSSELDVNVVTKNLVEMFKLTNVFVGLDPKIAKMLGLDVWKKFVKSVDQSTEHAYKLLIEGIKCLKDENISHSLQEDGILLKILEKFDSEEEVLRLLFSNHSESILTLSGAISWTIYSIARHPEVQSKILKEIHEVCGENSPVSVHDIPHLKYVHGVINETLRLYPVAPFTARTITHDTVIGGYNIPAGKICALSTMHVQQSPDYFTDPERFWPERWEKEEGSLNARGVKNKNAFIAFGVGQRGCVGRKLALQMLNLLVAQLVQNFEMECDEVTPIMRTILVPDKPLNLLLIPRKDAVSLHD